MTDAAVLGGLNMIDRVYFTSGKYTIMTGLAIVHDARMIKCCWQEPCGLMTLRAIAIGGYMILGFTCRGGTVVTRCTIIGNTLVIKGGAGKGRGVVANAAIVSGRNMRRICFSVLTGCICAVVTGIAARTSGHIAVIKHRRHPGNAGCMA